jgi:MYXO-CTERM domain-containing protein
MSGRKFHVFALALAGGVALAASADLADAAPVTFSAPGEIANDSNGQEIDNSGVYQFAWNAGGGPTVTVNGVQFLNSPTASTPSGITISHTSPNGQAGFNTALSYGPEMGSLMDSAIFSDGGGTFDLTLNGLTPGVSYRTQFISGQPSSSGGRLMQVTSGASSSAFYQVAGSLDEGGGSSKYLFANFTADSPSQLFTFVGDSASGSRAFLNGVSIAQVQSVPEPTALSVLGLAAAGLRRRRRSA